MHVLHCHTSSRVVDVPLAGVVRVISAVRTHPTEM